jgi:hypothetical protein
MKRAPNPQGKGHLPVLSALSETRARVAAVPPKDIEQVSAELFTSLFVLESDIRFRPVPGRCYWLYRKNGCFRLSLIAPREWPRSLSGDFIGECHFHEDMTWTLSLSEQAAGDRAFLDDVERRKAEFEQRLEQARSVDELLPFYRQGGAFYQRAVAFALARSLGISMEKAGIQGLTREQARRQLPAADG